ncbi:hypothetical protein P8825_14605 [Shouchella clausii]|uniref:hypothetical protein n=1 Tax=Shouchella clausii TaxID=79880 RepID=UPI002DB92437|nr:hypothetical protein [Shouchella clausii]MEB5480795.1 hypothetical protein [Shouchella clausii]
MVNNDVQITTDTLVKVTNHKPTEYSAYVAPTQKTYNWYPATHGVPTSYDLTFAEVQYLHNASSTFTQGWLTIENEEVRKMLGLDLEHIKDLNMTSEEIKKALTGNIAAFKKLSKFAGNRDKMFQIIEVAKSVGINNTTKVTLLAEWAGMSREKLLDDLDDNNKE